MNSPHFSIITVCLNDSIGLNRTMMSVVRQRFRNKEHIIVDGGSTDGTVPMLETCSPRIPRLRWISEPDNGIWDAMNKGLDMARGKYVMFLNAGDTFACNYPYVLGEVAASSADIIYGPSRSITPDGEIARYNPVKRFTRWNILRYGMGVVCHNAVFVRREIAPKYSLRYPLMGDMDWFLRIIDRKPDLYPFQVDFPIVDYHLGGFSDKKPWLIPWNHMRVVRDRCGFFAMVRYAPLWEFVRVAGYMMLKRGRKC